MRSSRTALGSDPHGLLYRGFCDADSRYCGEPHPRHRHRDSDRPVCWVFPGCSWRECRSTSGSGTAKNPERTTHIRIPASVCTMGYLPFAQWTALPAAEKGQALDPETRLEAGAGRGVCLDRRRVCQTRKTHLCCTAAAVSR